MHQFSLVSLVGYSWNCNYLIRTRNKKKSFVCWIICIAVPFFWLWENKKRISGYGIELPTNLFVRFHIHSIRRRPPCPCWKLLLVLNALRNLAKVHSLLYYGPCARGPRPVSAWEAVIPVPDTSLHPGSNTLGGVQLSRCHHTYLFKN